MTGQDRKRRMTRRAARTISLSVLALCIGALAASIPLYLASRDDPSPRAIYVIGDAAAERVEEVRAEIEEQDPRDFSAGDDTSIPGVFALVLLCLLWVGVGSLIVSRQPTNWAGWIFVTVGAPLPLLAFVEAVIRYGVRIEPGSIPFLDAWALAGEFVLYPFALLPLLFLLYPDGRPPSPRWRWAVRALLAGTGVAFLGFTLRPGPLNNWVELGVLYVNPIGIGGLGGVSGGVIAVGAIVALVASGSTVIAVRQRYKRSRGEERQQMRWLVLVASLAGAAFALMFIAVPIFEAVGVSEDETDIFDWLFALTAFTLIVGLPAAYVIAIFRHGLYDLDLVVKKTVQFGLLLALFLGIGILVVAAVPAALIGFGEETSTLPVLILAAILAAAFIWLRPRAARLANRIVYGRRATPYEVLSAFSERVGETYSTDDVLPRMAQLVVDATGARRADVWLRVGSELRAEASWPAGAGRPAVRPLDHDAVTLDDDEHVAEVRHQGELLGAITLEPSPDDPMDPSKEVLVRDLASQAGLVLRNVGLIEELRASRQRLVAAQDAERRKLERNLHDGVQQQLVALTVQLRLAEQLSERDPAKARSVLAELQGRSTEALEDLRDLARGIYPPLLADKGLPTALEAQGRRSPVPVVVDAEGVNRYPQAVEAAVYFSCLEALNNVAKYAEASRVTISLTDRDGVLGFAVTDDGGGFDPTSTGYGTGLQGIADRLDAIGGELNVASRVGEGTTLEGRVPVVAQAR